MKTKKELRARINELTEQLAIRESALNRLKVNYEDCNKKHKALEGKLANLLNGIIEEVDFEFEKKQVIVPMEPW